MSETQREWIQQPLTRKQELRLGAGLGAAAVVGGHSGLFRAAAARAASRSTTLTVGIPNDVGGWDFDYIAFNLTGIMVLKNTYPFAIDYGLTHLNGAPVADTEKYVPGFAQSFNLDKAKKVWTLKMRPGRNGRAATRSRRGRQVVEGSRVPGAGERRRHLPADRPDGARPGRARRRLHRPLPPGVPERARAAGPDHLDVPLRLEAPQVARDRGDPWAKAWANANPQEGGAYNVQSYTPGQSLDAAGEPGFPLGKPDRHDQHADHLLSPANMRLQLQKGDIDMALGLSPNDIQQLKSKGVKVISVPSNDQVNVELNIKMAPLNDVIVRRALAFAVPYPQII